MSEHDEMVEELKHLVHYYSQAAHEFFDDAGGELQERLDALYSCLEKDKNSLEEYKRMVEFIVTMEENLKKRVEDLVYLRERMNLLLKGLE